MSILSDLLADVMSAHPTVWHVARTACVVLPATGLAATTGPGLLRKAWSHVRTAMRPLPRPGVVLIEDFLTPGDTSWMPDLCDCMAEMGAAPEKHRAAKGGASACPRWRRGEPAVLKAVPRWGLTQEEATEAFLALAGVSRAPKARPGDAVLERMERGEAVTVQEAATVDGRHGMPAFKVRSDGLVMMVSAKTGGIAVVRPEASVVIRSPMPPSRPEYRRPAPTPVPGGGTNRSG